MTKVQVSQLSVGLASNTRVQVSKLTVSVPSGATPSKVQVSKLTASVAGGTATRVQVSKLTVEMPPIVEMTRTPNIFSLNPGEETVVTASPVGATFVSWDVAQDPDYGTVFSGSNGTYSFEAPYDKDGAEFDVVISGETAGGVSGEARIRVVVLPHNRWLASGPGVWDIPIPD